MLMNDLNWCGGCKNFKYCVRILDFMNLVILCCYLVGMYIIIVVSNLLSIGDGLVYCRDCSCWCVVSLFENDL